MKRLIKNTLQLFGFDLVRYQPNRPSNPECLQDLSDTEMKIVASVQSFTMTGLLRTAALLNAVTYLTTNKIEGDIAECGVWRGGSMMAVALTLLAHQDTNRSLYLYDTFEGMTSPTEHDKSSEGVPAQSLLDRHRKGTGVWCYAGLEDVRANMISTGYPADRIYLVKGKVEDTIPHTLPSRLSLLRLDTDWYESTKHELTYLFPLLDQKGILIIDDYGAWQGSKKAVDEYFAQHRSGIYLHRIDNTGRIAVKI
jgi:O-methyltransferase